MAVEAIVHRWSRAETSGQGVTTVSIWPEGDGADLGETRKMKVIRIIGYFVLALIGAQITLVLFAPKYA